MNSIFISTYWDIFKNRVRLSKPDYGCLFEKRNCTAN